MSTLLDLVSDLRTELRMDPNDKIWTQATKEAYINQAYLQIQRDGQFNWRENQKEATSALVGGTEQYVLPSDFIRMDYIQISNNNNTLKPVDIADVRRRGISGSSQPNEYYLYGGEIGYYPVPDSAYNVLMLYRRRLPLLTSSQNSLLPEDFDPAIVKYAAYLAWSSPRGEAAVAAQKLQDYELALKTLRLAYLMQDSGNLKFGYQRAPINNRSDKALYDD